MTELGDKMAFKKEMRRRKHSSMIINENKRFVVKVKGAAIVWHVEDENGILSVGAAGSVDTAWDRFVEFRDNLQEIKNG